MTVSVFILQTPKKNLEPCGDTHRGTIKYIPHRCGMLDLEYSSATVSYYTYNRSSYRKWYDTECPLTDGLSMEQDTTRYRNGCVQRTVLVH